MFQNIAGGRYNPCGTEVKDSLMDRLIMDEAMQPPECEINGKITLPKDLKHEDDATINISEDATTINISRDDATININEEVTAIDIGEESATLIVCGEDASNMKISQNDDQFAMEKLELKILEVFQHSHGRKRAEDFNYQQWGVSVNDVSTSLKHLCEMALVYSEEITGQVYFKIEEEYCGKRCPCKNHVTCLVLHSIALARNAGIGFAVLQYMVDVMSRELLFALSTLKTRNEIKYVIPHNNLDETLYFLYNNEISESVQRTVPNDAPALGTFLTDGVGWVCLFYLRKQMIETPDGSVSFHKVEEIRDFLITIEPIQVAFGLQDIHQILHHLISEGKVQARETDDGETIYGILPAGINVVNQYSG